jgi:hypothetical protein
MRTPRQRYQRKRSEFKVSSCSGIMLEAGSEKQETFLEEVEYVTSMEERESIFCDHRNDMQHKLVNSVNIYSAVPRFFDMLRTTSCGLLVKILRSTLKQNCLGNSRLSSVSRKKCASQRSFGLI